MPLHSGISTMAGGIEDVFALKWKKRDPCSDGRLCMPGFFPLAYINILKIFYCYNCILLRLFMPLLNHLGSSHKRLGIPGLGFYALKGQVINRLLL